MSKTTVSTEVQRVECPRCAKVNDLTDVQIDGCLEPGFDFDCSECDAPLLIEAVDWEPVIYVKLDEEAIGDRGADE